VDDLTKPPNVIPFHKKGKAGRRRAEMLRVEQIEKAEQDLYAKSLAVMRDVAYFGDINPAEQTQPPREWVREVGAEEAQRRLRICQAAWLPMKDAPSGLGLAKYVVGAFAKARSDAKRPPTLNVQMIQMVVAPEMYPEIEIVDEGQK
jgi:hypothetical protein